MVITGKLGSMTTREIVNIIAKQEDPCTKMTVLAG